MTFVNDPRLPRRPGDRRNSLDAEAAQAIAIRALAFIAVDPVLLPRFLALTGLDPASLRRAAQEDVFLPGVLDFILGHEPTLVAFCEAEGLPLHQVPAARLALRPVDEDPE